VRERGFVRASDIEVLTGTSIDASDRSLARMGRWIVASWYLDVAIADLRRLLAAHHATRPLSPGMEIAEAARALGERVDPGVLDAMVERLVAEGSLVRERTVLRLPGHRLSTRGRDDADRLIDAVAAAEPNPPTVKDLVGSGFGLDLIAAVCAEGRLVRVSRDIVVSPELLARAETVVRDLGRPPGMTVSAFRQALGTSRKYALPILDHFDSKGLTRRSGDLRILRGS
jgi:selenocysteine-specific elongation factor